MGLVMDGGSVGWWCGIGGVVLVLVVLVVGCW